MKPEDDVRLEWALRELDAVEAGSFLSDLTPVEVERMLNALREIDRSARLIRRVIERDPELRELRRKARREAPKTSGEGEAE